MVSGLREPNNFDRNLMPKFCAFTAVIRLPFEWKFHSLNDFVAIFDDTSFLAAARQLFFYPTGAKLPFVVFGFISTRSRT